MTDKKACYICRSDKYVDEHHYDCVEGVLSSDTIPLCRRCHRTYHNFGVDWFEDEYLDKAIEIENRKRELRYANFKAPVKPLELMTKGDVRRSSYWNKIHNLPVQKKTKAIEASCQSIMKLVFSND